MARGRVALALALVAVIATQGCGVDAHGRRPAAVARADRRDAAPTTAPTTIGSPVAVVPASSSTQATPATTVTTAAPAPVAITAPVAIPPKPSAPTPQQLGAEAVRLVRYDLARLPGWEIAFLPGRSGFQGRTFPDRRRIEVYVSSADSAKAVSYNLAHEVGHAVDLTYSTRASRLTYRAIRRIPAATLWFGCGDCPDFATPAGDFAETFGLTVTDPAYDWRSRMGPRPTTAERAAIVALYHP